MTLHDQSPKDAQPRAGHARIDVRAVADDTIVLTLGGEHDLFTKLRLLEALADVGEEPNVIIDLTPCEFIDSSIIGALAAASQADSPASQHLALVAPEDDGPVWRTLQLAGGLQLFPIHETLEDAMHSLLMIDLQDSVERVDRRDPLAGA